MILDDQDTKTNKTLKKEGLYALAGIGLVILTLIFIGHRMALKEVRR